MNQELRAEALPLGILKPLPGNPKEHDLDGLGEASERWGFVDRPVVNERTGHVISGNGRRERLLSLKASGKTPPGGVTVDSSGEWLVPCDVVDLPEEEEEALALALNELTIRGGYNEGLLAAAMARVMEKHGEAGLRGTGFDKGRAEALIAKMQKPTEGLTDPDEVPDNAPTRCQFGDLWELGAHRILCGDSTKADQVERLMGGEKAGLCFTSPPYDQQRHYESGIGDWLALMKGVFANVPMAPDGQVLVNLGLIHHDGEWVPYWDPWIVWIRGQGWRRFGWYVWDQGPGMPGDWVGRLAPSHEFVFHFNRESRKPEKARECKYAGEAHGGKGQRGTDGVVKPRHAGTAPVQDMAILDSVVRVNRQGASHDAGGHPAPYPVGLPRAFLASWPGIVYDPFSGSGTTIIACEQLGRKCRAIEIEPKYVDVSLARWEKFTGKTAKRIGNWAQEKEVE